LTLINIKKNILDDRGLVDQFVLNLRDGGSKNKKGKRDARGATKNVNDENEQYKGIFLGACHLFISCLIFILCYIININVLDYKYQLNVIREKSQFGVQMMNWT
jgi:hypothetical protein